MFDFGGACFATIMQAAVPFSRTGRDLSHALKAAGAAQDAVRWQLIRPVNATTIFMAQADKEKAYSILGVAPGVSRPRIDEAYKALLAFWSAADAEKSSIKELADKARVELEEAYKVVCELQAAGGGASTVSGGTGNQATQGPGGNKNPLAWVVGLLIVGGLLYQLNSKEPAKVPEPPTPSPFPGPAPSAEPEVITSPQPASPPAEIVPFIHNDDIKEKVVRWSSGWETINGGKRFVVWGYASNNEPQYKFELYLDGGTYRLWRLYEIRYSADRLQVGVQRFKERGAVAEFKDQRNVSDAGDVLEQTTIYNYLQSGKLDSVAVETPMIKEFDGLTINRYGTNVEGIRKRGGAPVSLGSNVRWLDDVFDLWNVYGQPDL